MTLDSSPTSVMALAAVMLSAMSASVSPFTSPTAVNVPFRCSAPSYVQLSLPAVSVRGTL